MISGTVLAICLLLCANHVANGYILLSANIEDIKKVASKFLSSDIVEQLTSLIGKFKSDNKINLSEENKKNEKTINRISDDEIDVRAPTRPKPTKSKPKDETEKRAPRYKMSAYLNEISQEKQKRPGGRYKIAESANELFKDESEERPRYKNTPDSLRERDTNDNRQNKDREGDLYWNDDEEQRIESVVATSGRFKLPRENRGIQPKYNWDISSDK